MKIQDLFDRGAADYDTGRRKVIPCFDSFYNALVGQIPFGRDRDFSFLDLGAGTGLVSALILASFPGTCATLVDLSPGMLDIARDRFRGDDRVLGFHTMDYARCLPQGQFDVVVSAMSVHHLSHPDKQHLFRMIHDCLSPGGPFIHADLIQGETPEADHRFKTSWWSHIRAQGFGGETLKGLEERMAQDRPAKLSEQLAWMTRAGFRETDCFFEYNNFAVYAGVK